MAEIVATTSLPVDRLTAINCNAAARANIAILLFRPSYLRNFKSGFDAIKNTFVLFNQGNKKSTLPN